MHAIDFSHKITPKYVIFEKILQKKFFSIFDPGVTPLIHNSSNDFYTGNFMRGNRLCAFPNPENASKITPRKSFQIKKYKKWSFSNLKPQFFPESGSRKHDQSSGMRAIDFSHKITPIGVIFSIKNAHFFH
jgi:hypothetical protein